MGYNSFMTIEEYLEKSKNPLWYGEQDENGLDLSIIRENLNRTPTERLHRGERATSDCLWIRANVKGPTPKRFGHFFAIVQSRSASKCLAAPRRPVLRP